MIVKQTGNLTYFQHDFTELNEEDLLTNFENLDLSYLNYSSSSINAKFNIFLSRLDELVKNHALAKKLSKKQVKLKNKP